MDARFAGSQRLGERRRRRLAVESDDSAHEGTAPATALPAPEGVRRVSESARLVAGSAAAVQLPLDGLIPIAAWKYFVGGAVALAVAAGILAAGWYESLWLPIAGSAATRLFSLADGTVAKWYSGLLLTLSAQLALVIWWGRSRSLKDFEGRYRPWVRTASAWLIFGFCAATGAHRAAAEALVQFGPAQSARLEVAAWLGPAALAGLLLLGGLNREMSECRASRLLLFAAGAAYAAGAIVEFKIDLPLEPRLFPLFSGAAALLGHCGLFLSMWLHARHVLHFTADPSRASRRRLRIPRPHFRVPLRFGWGRKQKSPLQPADVTELEPRERKGRARKSSEAGKSPSKREVPAPVGEHEPLTLPPRKEPPPLAPAPPVAPPKAAPPTPTVSAKSEQLKVELKEERKPPVAPEPPATEGEDSGTAEGADESMGEWNEPFPKPDLRGLSKKQRRRLMQELREKERAARRQ